ncbi:MAG: acyl-CoA thioesterase [Flavobacteriaceae bacterium]|nr:acyl-CoA thioesterase [Flavobacteriaceae bacterium]
MKIADFKVVTTINVQWGEMDAYRHVNNVSYVRWGETARIDYFIKIGLINSNPEKSGYAPILGFQSVKYIAPLEYPDTIQIGTRIEEIREDRIIFRSYHFSEKQDRLAAIMVHEVIIIDPVKGSKVLMPNYLTEKIKALEGPSNPFLNKDL